MHTSASATLDAVGEAATIVANLQPPTTTSGASSNTSAYGCDASDELAAWQPPLPTRRRGAWFFDALIHLETALIVALPLAPVVATFVTVLDFVNDAQPTDWQNALRQLPIGVLLPGNLVMVWLLLALPVALLRLGSAARANPASHGQLHNRLLSLAAYRADARRAATGAGHEGADVDAALNQELSMIWRALDEKGPRWILGSGFISLWRQTDHIDSLVNYVLPTARVWARAKGMLMRTPAPSKSARIDFRTPLMQALADLCTGDQAGPQRCQNQGRATVAQVQMLIDSGRTDRYSAMLRCRNIMLAACAMTSIALYAIFWLGMVELTDRVLAHTILGSALFFTTVGALVGLFQLLYIESHTSSGVDDYGVSLARLVVAPQIAGLAALVGVVLTSLTTATLAGTPVATGLGADTSAIPLALKQIGQPANVLVAVGFALSPGLVLSRFRERVEESKRELSKSGAGLPARSDDDL